MPRVTPVSNAPRLRARDLVGGVGGEEQHAICDVLSLPRLPQRHPGLATSLRSIGTLLPAATCVFVQIGVSMTLGWTVLTRMPSPAAAHSIATAFANSRTPPFVPQ
jgi:hypothetical protein